MSLPKHCTKAEPSEPTGNKEDKQGHSKHRGGRAKWNINTRHKHNMNKNGSKKKVTVLRSSRVNNAPDGTNENQENHVYRIKL